MHEVEHADKLGVCALKILKNIKNNSRSDRFRREVETMRRLHRDGVRVVPEVLDSDLDVARPWFAMPWYEEGSLEQHIVDGTYRGDVLASVRVLTAIASALQSLHRADVAHRDLKPANILLDGPSVFLADLGLCLDERSERLTATDEAVGARLYTAPENESGRNPSSDQRPADFYAFGKILWACFAGSQPLARERQLERDWSLTAILNDERFDTLRQLQEQLLVLDPERRLNDWPHVIRTLEAFGSYVSGGAPTVRDCLAAALGVDNRIYVVGGQRFGGGALDVLEVFDPSHRTWNKLPPMPTPRLLLRAACGSDERIYAIGGEWSGGYSNAVEAYAPDRARWQQCRSMSVARADMAVAAGPDGRILVAGGLGRDPAVSDLVEAYDPAADTWSRLRSLPTARRGAVAALACDGLIYVIGGLAPVGGRYLDVVEAWDPRADTWHAVAPMPTPRAWLAATVAPDGRIFAVGGHSEQHGDLNVVEIYNPIAGTWTQGQSLHLPRSNHAAVVDRDGRLHVFGSLSLSVFETVG